MWGARFLVASVLALAVGGSLSATSATARGATVVVRVTETTAGGADAMASLAAVRLSKTPPKGVPVIVVEPGARFQRVRGFGAALTDSSAWLIHDRLEPATRARLMDNLFGARGLHLDFLRLPIGASDFTARGRPYTYDDLPAGESDPLLQHFSIAHDRAYIIPTVRRALSLDPRIEIMATPWSPPPWMKANQAFDNVAALGTLLPSDYGPLAGYFVRFLEAYAAAGIRVAAVTPQNEPQGQSRFPGMNLPWWTQAMWITRYLEPALRAAGLRTEIYAADVGWSAAGYQDALVRSSARRDIDGVAWHCYGGSPAVMGHLRLLAPRLDQVVSECATQITAFTPPEAIIDSLRHGASTVALWNLALTPGGGPVEPPNSGCRGCRGVVTVDPRARTVGYGLTYDQVGQFSRFIARGATRIGSTEADGIDDVAVRNPDGTVVLVAYNATESKSEVAVQLDHTYLTCALPAAATATFVWR